MSNNAANSPCINVCRLDPSGMGIGCGRLLNEIAAWSQMTALQQAAVRELALRRLSTGEQLLREEAEGKQPGSTD